MLLLFADITCAKVSFFGFTLLWVRASECIQYYFTFCFVCLYFFRLFFLVPHAYRLKVNRILCIVSYFFCFEDFLPLLVNIYFLLGMLIVFAVRSRHYRGENIVTTIVMQEDDLTRKL